MQETRDSLIARIAAASEQARTSGAANSVEFIGEILWNQVLSENPTTQQQEAAVIKYAKLITSAVRGFSDYADCFWEISHFLELSIANLSPKAALHCAQVGVVMYGTEDTSDQFSAGWAQACISRCVQWLTIDATVGFTDSDIATIQAACSVLKAVADGGGEYRELLQASADLNQAIVTTLTLVEGNPTDTVFSRVDRKRLAPISKLLREITALCSNSSDEVLTCLEMSVDIEDHKSWSGGVLLEAYNAMCEEKPADLALQLKAAQGPLAQLAVKVLQTHNEGKQGKKHLFMESAVFIKLLLSPWNREDPAIMGTKLQIATILRDLGLLDALLRHFTFWVVEWSSAYADCGMPIFIALYELLLYFPELVESAVLPHEHAVALIRSTAARYKSRPPRLFGATYETAESVSVKLENLLDGKPIGKLAEEGAAIATAAPAAGGSTGGLFAPNVANNFFFG